MCDSNTSHVFIYHPPNLKKRRMKQNSNTSHVFIYLGSEYEPTTDFEDSNTSHVFIYHFFHFCYLLSFIYSNTSHVFIYRQQSIIRLMWLRIQIHPMFLFIVLPSSSYVSSGDSNTSHVFIYPTLNHCWFNVLWQFKYIPCFYLSDIFENGITLWHIFKYIPCFYLSNFFYFFSIPNDNSNTSHVFIYRVNNANTQKSERHSNTSHVFIYPHCKWVVRRRCQFKYIPCFYLSWWINRNARKWQIQIHPMFLFIIIYINRMKCYLKIQIHPMFLFINSSLNHPFNISRFKYIPCFYLSMWQHLIWH